MKQDSNVITGGYLVKCIIVDPQFIVNGSYVTFDQVSTHFAGLFLSSVGGSEDNIDEMVGFGGLGGGGSVGPQGNPGKDGSQGLATYLEAELIEDAAFVPGPQGNNGQQGVPGPATHLLVNEEEYQEPIVIAPFVMPLVDIAYYAPGSFFLPDGSFAYMLNRLILTGSQEVDLRGNSRLCIEGAF